ncbi:MAG: type II and III secretion system protein family protein [Pseudomonadota bacterium]|nr:type II and III secretion system protein family protein [Pseudomonadota bacterium]QKK05021.1 MAG: type II and III secretion system protein family protein [Pseudomonadota bacterium]
MLQKTWKVGEKMKAGLKRSWGIRSVSIVLICALAAAIMFSAETARSLTRQSVHLEIGKAKTVNLPYDIADVLVANPSVADVGVLRTNRLYIVGQSIGDTNILTFDENGNLLAEIQVHVRVNQETLQETITEFFPNEKISVRTVGTDIVLGGSVSNANTAAQVRDLAGRFRLDRNQALVDMMVIEGERQVLLRVKIVEVNRTALRELGVETDYSLNAAALDNGLVNNAAGNILNLNGTSGIGLPESATAPFGVGTLFLSDGLGFGPLNLTLRALERDGFANTLAEPNLTAISGEEAGFLAGGEFPVPVSRDQNGNLVIEFHPFGVSLNFRPTVMSNDRISLLLSTEVSTLAPQEGLSLAGIEIPGFQVRRAQTTVEMGSGGSLMIAGLIQSDTTNALNQMPGIGNIPVLGELFKSRAFQRSETELLIVISPILVEPFAEKQADIHEAPADQETPLEKALLFDLRRTYGKESVPEKMLAGQRFGYMID